MNKNGAIIVNAGGDRIKIGNVKNVSQSVRKTFLEKKDINELLNYT